MKSLKNFEINAETRLTCLIGDPIEKSFSPKIHNAWFNYFKLNYVYLAFKIPSFKLKEAINGLRILNVIGFNVTIPHKISIINFLDGIDSQAKNIGAVNTVLNKNDKFIGFNTDIDGVFYAFDKANVSINGSTCLIIGAGGAAKACAHAFSIRKCKKIIILNRSLEKAISLSKEIKEKYNIESLYEELNKENIKKFSNISDIIVNATPIGSYYTSNESIFPKELLREDLVIFDVVYNPIKTKLIEDAIDKGAKIVYGMDMLIGQAAKAFKIWTGLEPPIEIAFNILKSELSFS
ncbi:MAG: shikimate dehydrogenase [Nitrososphaerota archaeon]